MDKIKGLFHLYLPYQAKITKSKSERIFVQPVSYLINRETVVEFCFGWGVAVNLLNWVPLTNCSL